MDGIKETTSFLPLISLRYSGLIKFRFGAWIQAWAQPCMLSRKVKIGLKCLVNTSTYLTFWSTCLPPTRRGLYKEVFYLCMFALRMVWMGLKTFCIPLWVALYTFMQKHIVASATWCASSAPFIVKKVNSLWCLWMYLIISGTDHFTSYQPYV